MRKTVVLTLSVLVVCALAFAGDFEYIGSKKCKMCHKGEKKGNVFEKWEQGPHVKAFESLKAKGEDKNPQCLECHTTGYNAGGFKVGDPNCADFEGVGCESCHGPGSAYKSMSIMKDKQKAMENGLIEPTEEVCKKCHNEKSPTFKGFNFQEWVKKIDHTYEKNK